jgi:hypothetical protein
MRWQGHVSVPGVSPEREKRLTACLPASVAQRRDPAPYRSQARSFLAIAGRAAQIRPTSQSASTTAQPELSTVERRSAAPRGRRRRTKRVRKLLALTRAIRTRRRHGTPAFGGGRHGSQTGSDEAPPPARPDSKAATSANDRARARRQLQGRQTASCDPLGCKHQPKSRSRSRLAGVAPSLALSSRVRATLRQELYPPAVRWKDALCGPFLGSGALRSATD